MKILLLPFVMVEKIMISGRDSLWSFPNLFISNEDDLSLFHKIYQSTLPYSNFVISALVTFLLIVSLTLSGLPKIFSSTNKNTLTEAVVTGFDSEGNIQSLTKVNPLLSSNIQLEKDVVELVYEPLIKIDYVDRGDGTFIGGIEEALAQKVITNIPGSSYEFVLKRNVTWHDGEVFNADDVLRTVEILSSINNDNPNSNAFTRALKEMHWEKLDDFTIRVCTKPSDDFSGPCEFVNNAPIFSNFLELISFKIIPEHLSGDINSNNVNSPDLSLYRSPIGSGKFILDRVDDTGITLKLNENYHSFGIVDSQDFRLPVDWNQSDLQALIINNKEVIGDKEINDILNPNEYLQTIQNREFEGEILFINSENDDSLPGNSNTLTFQSLDFDFESRIRNLQFRYYASVDQAISALKSGEIHSISSLSTANIDKLDEVNFIQEYESPVLYNQFWGLYFNLRQNPDGNTIGKSFLQDPEIRRSIGSAINRESIIQNSLNGIGQEAFGPIPEISYFFNNDAPWPTHNTEDPSKILDEAGWVLRSGDQYRSKLINAESPNQGREVMEFTLHFVQSEDRYNIANQIKNDLEEIGIKVNIVKAGEENNSDWKGWEINELNEQYLAPRLFDVILYGINTFIDPDRYELYHSSQSNHPGLNIAGYESEERTIRVNRDRDSSDDSGTIEVSKVDQFLEEARSFDPVEDIEARQERYFEVQELLAKESPLIYLYHPQYIYFANSRISNVNLDGAETVEDRFRNIYQWKINR